MVLKQIPFFYTFNYFYPVLPEEKESNLKNEIVSNFDSVHHQALVNLIYTYNYIMSQLDVLFKSHKMSRQQFNVLRILRGQYPNPATMNLIKARMLDKMSDASRIVERLRIKGWVTRTKSLKDRRAVEVVISEKGLVLLKELDVHADKFEALMLNLSTEDAEKLNQLLDKVRQKRNG